MEPNSTAALALPELKRKTVNISPILITEGFYYILSGGMKKGKGASYVFPCFLLSLFLIVAWLAAERFEEFQVFKSKVRDVNS